MAKIADSYSEYIEALNTELSMGKELKTVDLGLNIYNL